MKFFFLSSLLFPKHYLLNLGPRINKFRLLNNSRPKLYSNHKLSLGLIKVSFQLQCEMALPVFHTAFTDATADWTGYGTRRGPCNIYYEDFKKCISVVPYPKASFVCDKFRADFAECAIRDKQMARVKAMTDERKRQGRQPLPPTPLYCLDKKH
ncbi:uncharacterized protein LOC131946395 isoform X1 [Physella acuta]|uniref:uncharacterized protein LOC131946395 isoform X1 n=1 Tax=Physella acuta TaxID=109671 RepID=UPI0027DD49C7|nr:uncharacterized protein LOC131946395 isoform X1 [Physella acuta]